MSQFARKITQTFHKHERRKPEYISRIEANDPTLTVLDLEGDRRRKRTRIGNKGAIALAEAVQRNTTLTRLGIVEHDIGDDGASSLAEALRVNTTLLQLYLYGNAIRDKGASSLAEALKCNISLQELWLHWNAIGDGGGNALSEALDKNTTLTELSLAHNAIEDFAILDSIKDKLKGRDRGKAKPLEKNSNGQI